jgi:hypothetical protein
MRQLQGELGMRFRLSLWLREKIEIKDTFIKGMLYGMY